MRFDRRDIAMNKLGVSTLESQVICYDLRTYHPTEGDLSDCEVQCIYGCFGTFLVYFFVFSFRYEDPTPRRSSTLEPDV